MTPIFILRILNVITSVQNFCLLSYSKLMYPWHTAHFVRDQLSFSPELQCNVGCCFLCSALPRRTTRIQQPCLCWGSSALPSLLEADQISYQTVLCRAKVRSLLWSPSCNSAQTLGDGLLWIAFLPLLWVIPDIYGGCLLTTSASFFPNLSVLVWILRILSPGLPFPVLLLRGQGGVFSSLLATFQSTWPKAVIRFFVCLVAADKCFCFNCFSVQLIGCWGESICDSATLCHHSDYWPTINATYAFSQLLEVKTVFALILPHFQGHIFLVNTST